MNDFRQHRSVPDKRGRRVPVPSTHSRAIEDDSRPIGHLIKTTQPELTPEKVELPDKFVLISDGDESRPANRVSFDYSVCTVVRPAPTSPEELHQELLAQRDELKCKLAVDMANMAKAYDAFSETDDTVSGEGARQAAGEEWLRLGKRAEERQEAIDFLQKGIDQLEASRQNVTPDQGTTPSREQPVTPAGTGKEPASPPAELAVPRADDSPEAQLPEVEGAAAGTRIAPPEGRVSSPVQQELIAILRDAGAMTFSDSQALEAYVMRRAEGAGIELSITPEGIEAQQVDAVDPTGVGATLREAGINDEKLIARAIRDTNALLRAAESFVVAAQGAAKEFGPTLKDPLDLMDQWRSLVPPAFVVTAKDEASPKLEFRGQTPMGVIVTGHVTNQTSDPTQTNLPLGVTVEPFTSIFDQYEGLGGKVLISPTAPSGDSTVKQ